MNCSTIVINPSYLITKVWQSWLIEALCTTFSINLGPHDVRVFPWHQNWSSKPPKVELHIPEKLKLSIRYETTCFPLFFRDTEQKGNGREESSVQIEMQKSADLYTCTLFSLTQPVCRIYVFLAVRIRGFRPMDIQGYSYSALLYVSKLILKISEIKNSLEK